jgi:hypothetical protein
MIVKKDSVLRGTWDLMSLVANEARHAVMTSNSHVKCYETK